MGLKTREGTKSSAICCYVLSGDHVGRLQLTTCRAAKMTCCQLQGLVSLSSGTSRVFDGSFICAGATSSESRGVSRFPCHHALCQPTGSEVRRGMSATIFALVRTFCDCPSWLAAWLRSIRVSNPPINPLRLHSIKVPTMSLENIVASCVSCVHGPRTSHCGEAGEREHGDWVL